MVKLYSESAVWIKEFVCVLLLVNLRKWNKTNKTDNKSETMV